MGVTIRPSDLYHRYRRKKENLDIPKFSGTPDPHPFDRDDLYEVIPMFEQVMDRLGTVDQDVLHRLEEIVIYDLPLSIRRRDEVYDCLVATLRDLLESRRD